MRKKTRRLYIGDVPVGRQPDNGAIHDNTKTSDVKATVEQILELEKEAAI